MAKSELKDQQHPLYRGDRQLLHELLAINTPSDRHLADLARLKIRYRGFPGARDIQADLEEVLRRWQLTEATLFAKTRQLHATARVYGTSNDGRDDWA